MPTIDDQITNALSFDIEDWFHMVEIEAVADPESWTGFESIVERYTEWIIETVTDADVRATFFVLGWVAERYPHLVTLMADHGHEVATHSYWHRKVFELDATSSPGLYMVCFPDGAFATGVDQVTLALKYDATVVTEAQNIQLTDFDPFDAIRGYPT